MASLHELQAGLAAALRGGSGVAAAEIVSDDLDSTSRLQVYRNNARAMFLGALERTCPVLRRRVGDDYFQQLAHAYRNQHPSRSGDLHWVGRHFPQFVADQHAGTEYAWLADLAALEWACECALTAARDRPIGIIALADVGPDAIGDIRLELQPSLRCVSSPFPVLDVWRSNQPEADGRPVDLASGAQCALVSCEEAGLELREVVPQVLEFVRALQDGASLGEAVDRSGLGHEAITGALGLLFDAGLVTGIGRVPRGTPVSALLRTANRLAEAVTAPLVSLLLLATRSYVSWQFLKSGWLKLTGWENTLFLFEEEYRTPFLPPAMAAVAGTFGELMFPTLLIVGLASRYAAAGLAVNLVAVVSYAHVLLSKGFEAALGQHYLWGFMLLVLTVLGPGRWALDAIFERRATLIAGGLKRNRGPRHAVPVVDAEARSTCSTQTL